MTCYIIYKKKSELELTVIIEISTEQNNQTRLM